ncbi:MAG TPA: stage 0 sporulation protein [Desulfobacteraceae bacterium]|nr:stage 0 sporulation protein [Desulfobacteraceae bacterium]
MNKMIGVRFKPTGKVYNFDSAAFVLLKGDDVIVDTERGLSFGTVTVAPVEYNKESLKEPLKKVFRLAAEEDYEQRVKNLSLEDKSHNYCIQCIKTLGIKMSLFSVDASFDQTRLTFFFTAEGRVDFRKLVKMLVNKFHIKIEMRQVGIRNQAKMCGGIGRCGREICCSSFIDKFMPVSIRMAKEQGLSLNPTKISGLCGRLMCCLTFENDIYHDFKKKLPKVDKFVNTPQGKGKVIRHNVLRKKIIMQIGDDQIEIDADKVIKA